MMLRIKKSNKNVDKVNIVQTSGLYYHLIPEKFNNAVNQSLKENTLKLKKRTLIFEKILFSIRPMRQYLSTILCKCLFDKG